MDLHEEDKKHLENAWKQALKIVKKYNWIKINCEEK
jgi:hypothetical protein